MTAKEFHNQMRTTGAYVTPAEIRPARAAKAGFITTWRYHWGVFRFLWRGSRLAHHGAFDSAAWMDVAFGIMQVAEKLGTVVTFENFAPCAAVPGPVVYAANHMSELETYVLPAALMAYSKDGVGIVLKGSLRNYPVFGVTCRAINPIVVSRHNAREDLRQVLEQGKAQLAAGRSVLLFPQGTRSAVFNPAQFNSLATKLAQAAGVPLVPVALRTDMVGLGKVVRDFGVVDPERPVFFAAGNPIPAKTPAREMRQQCVEFITARLTAWGAPVAKAVEKTEA
jgi:1-acyl-sn-glycerol-3-phosphate acyltransferase